MSLEDQELQAELEALWDLQETYGHWGGALKSLDQCGPGVDISSCWVCTRVETLEKLLFGNPDYPHWVCRRERLAFLETRDRPERTTLPQWPLPFDEEPTLQLTVPETPRDSQIPSSEPNPYLEWPAHWTIPKVG